MPSARSVSRAFFPLDDELQLLPGHLTPSLQEHLTRLSTWMPFQRAAKEFHWFTHVTVSEPLTRRLAEAAGAAYVEVQTAEVERLERTTPEPPPGPPVQLVSVDGAMVPLVHGKWTEVKTLVVGTVQPPVLEKGEPVVHSTDLSYFSRLTDADTFTRLALVETHRRGVERASTTCGVTDGAPWEQGFLDVHRKDAVRILDFPHAAQYVTTMGQVAYGEGTPAVQTWLTDTLHELKQGSVDTVLAHLHTLQQTKPPANVAPAEPAPAAGVVAPAALPSAALAPSGYSAAQSELLQDSLDYLEKRRTHMTYAEFQAAGYPIGSGAVESANKVVVEGRLKGAGMHWTIPHVNPMLALRNIAYSERWEEAWPQIERQRRAQDSQGRLQRQQQRQLKRPRVLALPQSSRPEDALPPQASPTAKPIKEPKPASPDGKAHRPAENHPWRHMPIGRAIFLPRKERSSAKL